MTLDGAIPSIGLNPKWTFEEFVIRPSNAFAHAAALAVAQSPGAAYNPLYIFGGQGLGKTHLMQAIGHRVLKMTKKSVLYVSTETMLIEYINALQSRTITEFRHKYRSVDMLLVDDINFLAKNERLQDEFYHTFNARCASSRQIIMTCDDSPRGVAGLEQNLVSRFEWGLVTEIERPDVDLRMAILRSKQMHAKAQLSDESLTFLAENVTSNIRSLEGALLRTIAFESLIKQPLTIKAMRHILRDLIDKDSQEGCAGGFQESRPAVSKGQQTGSPLARPVHFEDNPENEGKTNVTLSTATREDGINHASRSPGEQMNIWKLGCRWGKEGPLFFDFLRNSKCVIGVSRISVYTRGDVILLTDGFHALGVALVVSPGTPAQGNSKYQELFKIYQVPDDVLAYDAEVYVLDQSDQFDYSMQQGIVQIRDNEYAQRTLKLVEKYKGRLDVQSPCQSHQSDEAHGEAPVVFPGLPHGLAEKTMIKIETIKDPCAEAVWQTRERDGTIVSQKFIFGEPQRVHETPNSDWYCPVMIEGLLPKIVPVMGVSSEDSITNAIHFVVALVKRKDALVDFEQK